MDDCDYKFNDQEIEDFLTCDFNMYSLGMRDKDNTIKIYLPVQFSNRTLRRQYNEFLHHECNNEETKVIIKKGN